MSIQIVFKNLDKSDLVRASVEEKIMSVLDKFSAAGPFKVRVTINMLNSPQKAGPDMFELTLHLTGSGKSNIILKKRSSNMYVALADLSDSLLELLNHQGDRQRVMRVNKQRRFLNKQSRLAED